MSLLIKLQSSVISWIGTHLYLSLQFHIHIMITWIGKLVFLFRNIVALEGGIFMTNVYFVRHAEPDYTNHNDMERPLTQKGLSDRRLVTQYLSDKGIDYVLSSPYIRSVDTVKDFADSYGHSIKIIDDFRERKIDSVWIEDFEAFSKIQWSDFHYKLSDGECLYEVQCRNIDALMQVIKKYCNKNIVIGSHGTALSTIINYFKPEFGADDFQRIKGLMPWIVRFSFEGDKLVQIEEIDVFN